MESRKPRCTQALLAGVVALSLSQLAACGDNKRNPFISIVSPSTGTEFCGDSQLTAITAQVAGISDGTRLGPDIWRPWGHPPVGNGFRRHRNI